MLPAHHHARLQALTHAAVPRMQGPQQLQQLHPIRWPPIAHSTSTHHPPQPSQQPTGGRWLL